MNKKRFLEELGRQLKHLPAEDKVDAIQYYTEYLEEMELSDDANVVEILGTPKEVAREIIGNCTEKHLEEHKEKAGVKSSFTLIWLIILGICASPIAIPLVAIALLIIAVLVAAGVIMVGSFIFAGIAVALVGVMYLMISFVAIGFFSKLKCIGMGLILLSLGILFVFGIVKLSQLCIRFVAWLFSRKRKDGGN